MVRSSPVSGFQAASRPATEYVLSIAMAEQLLRAMSDGKMQPAIEPDIKAARSVLRIGLFDPAQQLLNSICLSVTIFVVREQDIGCGDNQSSVAPGHDAGRIRKSIEKNLHFIELFRRHLDRASI